MQNHIIHTNHTNVIDFRFRKDYTGRRKTIGKELRTMERIKTLETRNLCESAKKGGCGECQTSCQSACKTSCGVANQKCENEKK